MLWATVLSRGPPGWQVTACAPQPQSPSVNNHMVRVRAAEPHPSNTSALLTPGSLHDLPSLRCLGGWLRPGSTEKHLHFSPPSVRTAFWGLSKDACKKLLVQEERVEAGRSPARSSMVIIPSNMGGSLKGRVSTSKWRAQGRLHGGSGIFYHSS